MIVFDECVKITQEEDIEIVPIGAKEIGCNNCECRKKCIDALPDYIALHLETSIGYIPILRITNSASKEIIGTDLENPDDLHSIIQLIAFATQTNERSH